MNKSILPKNMLRLITATSIVMVGITPAFSQELQPLTQKECDEVMVKAATECFFETYVVAGFESETVAISCDEDKFPKALE